MPPNFMIAPENLIRLCLKHPNYLLGENKNILDYTIETPSSIFYNKQFNNGGKVYEKSNIKTEHVNLSDAPKEIQEIITFLKKNLKQDAVLMEIGGSKFQRRSGFPYHFFENYFPLDISQSSMIEYSSKYDRVSVACNAEKLPFDNNTIDALFTHTFLELPHNPDAVLKEIDRVIKPGGYVIHCDAWNCRWWNKYGIYKVKNGRKFNELTLKEKILYFTIVISEIKILRMPYIILKRAIKLLFGINKSKKNLRYGKLTPNYDLYLYTDEDAAASIDPIDIITFYEYRGYKLIPNKSLLKKLFFRDRAIYFQKSV
jgi:ubiquinone/menaquinone biosynthesis C-methylase UbiE